MAWEITIQRLNSSPLGSIETVQRAMQDSLPEIRFERQPSGLEKIASVPFEFPEILRQHLEKQPATTQADYKDQDFSIQFYFGAGPLIEEMDAEVRGKVILSLFLFAFALQTIGLFLTVLQERSLIYQPTQLRNSRTSKNGGIGLLRK